MAGSDSNASAGNGASAAPPAPALTVTPPSVVERRRGFRFGWLAMILVFVAMAGTPVVIALIVTLGH